MGASTRARLDNEPISHKREHSGTIKRSGVIVTEMGDATERIADTRRGSMTAHACKSCRDKRTKCDGKQPCDRCRRREIDCRYIGKPWQSKDRLRQETEHLRGEIHQRNVILQAIACQPNPEEIVQWLRNGESVDSICERLTGQPGTSSSDQPEPEAPRELFNNRIFFNDRAMNRRREVHPQAGFEQEQVFVTAAADAILTDGSSTKSPFSTVSVTSQADIPFSAPYVEQQQQQQQQQQQEKCATVMVQRALTDETPLDPALPFATFGEWQAETVTAPPYTRQVPYGMTSDMAAYQPSWPYLEDHSVEELPTSY